MLNWLLEDDAPGVQYLARARLLGESPRSRRMLTLRRRCNEYPPVARMLARVDDAIAAGDYAKYRGAYWTLIFLAQVHADGRDPRARRLVEHVLATQLDNGGFSASGTPGNEIGCLTANVLWASVQLGYGDDDRVIRGYRRLAERILPHGGVPCRVLQTCLHTACKMTLPQTLRCLAAAPEGTLKKDMKKLRQVLVRQLLDVSVYRFVRPDVAEYHHAVKVRPKGVPERAVRERWIAERTFDDDELLPKPGWLRFGFPRSYNPDLLEGMLALAELGVEHDPAMDDALGIIESKRMPDGRWKLEESLNGKMLADIEKKGKPSKWVTLRAAIVLQRYRGLEPG
ncbi:MAG: hypothetical protein C4547_16495 [Phycisphaerales bacterium]|nr:MAG: hypothetical protein C4547_16495 [Phycisphaerales bacterium]